MKLTESQKNIITKGIENGQSRFEILEKLKIQRDVSISSLKEKKCFSRTTFKRATMTVSAYDAKFITVREYVKTELHDTKFYKNSNKDEISRFALDMFYQINKTMKAATSYKLFARKMLKHVLDNNDSIIYKSPLSGFPIVLKNNKIKKRKIVYSIPHSKRTGICCLLETTDETDKRKTISSSIPSIIHGIDAGILLRTKQLFNEPMATIHDSFGCHSNKVLKLKNKINISLEELFDMNVLDDLCDQLNYHEESPPDFGLDGTFKKIILKSEYSFN